MMNRPIAKLEGNLWTVDGDIRLPGGVFVRKMVLMRLRDGRIVIHSAIALEQSAMTQIERWGEPAFCIVPNKRHRLDAPAFRRHYPALSMICPAAGVFTSVKDLAHKLMRYIRHYNRAPKPIKWTYRDPSNRISMDTIAHVRGH
jgi:hypothetical protein